MTPKVYFFQSLNQNFALSAVLSLPAYVKQCHKAWIKKHVILLVYTVNEEKKFYNIDPQKIFFSERKLIHSLNQNWALSVVLSLPAYVKQCHKAWIKKHVSLLVYTINEEKKVL